MAGGESKLYVTVLAARSGTTLVDTIEHELPRMSGVPPEQCTCPGRLVVHAQGTVAFCSEVAAGRPCPGYDTPHASEPDPCWTRVAGEACVICDRSA